VLINYKDGEEGKGEDLKKKSKNLRRKWREQETKEMPPALQDSMKLSRITPKL
jgi:hypothetical protein